MKTFAVLLVLVAMCVGAGCPAKVADNKTNETDSTLPDRPKVVTEAPFPEATVVGLELKQSFRVPVKDEDGHEKAEVLVTREEKPQPGFLIKYLFEPLPVGPSHSHTFVLKNTGEGPLTVAQGPTSCQCTIAGIGGGKKTLVLKSGESTPIELKWEGKGFNPRFRQSAVIYTSDSKTQILQFDISGQIVDPIETYPNGQWTTGVIPGSKPKTIEGYLSSRVFDDLKVDKLEFDPTLLKVEHKKLNRDEIRKVTQSTGADYQHTRVMYKFTVTVLPAGRVGRFLHRVFVRTKLPHIAAIPIDVSGARAGPFLIEPENVRFWRAEAMGFSLGDFPAKQGTKGSLLLFVEGLKDRELKITGVKADPEYIKVSLEPATLSSDKNETGKGKSAKAPGAGERKLYRLTFTIPPGSPPEIRTRRDPARVTINTNYDRAKKISFMIVFDAQ